MPLSSVDLLKLLSVARHQSVSVAARELRIAQPALSRTIRSIERSLGFDLFRRTHTGMSPTPECDAIIGRASAIEAELRRLQRDVEQLRLHQRPYYVIGVEPVHPIDVVLDCLLALVERVERVSVRARVATMDELIAGLRAGEVDFIVGSLPEIPPFDGCVMEPVYLEDLVVACGRQSTLFRTQASPEDLVGQRWVAGPQGSFSQQQIADIQRSLNLTPLSVALEIDAVGSRIELVKKSALLSVFQPAQIRDAVAAGDLFVLPIAWRVRPHVMGILRQQSDQDPVYSLFLQTFITKCAAAGLMLPDRGQ